MNLYLFAQCQIAMLGCTAIYLLSVPPGDDRRKWGFVVGLLNQWAWFYTAYHDGAWGIFFINSIYALSYVRGIRSHFGIHV